MSTSDWINLVAAILVGGGTLFLGIMALRTIRQTRSIQKAEKRERLLNEIIEWAIDIMKCGMEKGSFNTSMDEMPIILEGITVGRTNYILQVASGFEEDLQQAVAKLTIHLQDFLNLLVKYNEMRNSKDKKLAEASKLLLEHIYKLRTSAIKVIEEATKIKTRDTS